MNHSFFGESSFLLYILEIHRHRGTLNAQIQMQKARYGLTSLKHTNTHTIFLILSCVRSTFALCDCRTDLTPHTQTDLRCAAV